MSNKIKEICGYLDDKGRFHKTLFECNNANIEYKIMSFKNDIQSLTISYARQYRSEFDHYFYKKDDIKGLSDFVETIFSQLLYYGSDKLIKFHKEKESIEFEINKLNKLRGKPKILRKDWWFRDEITFYKE